MRRVKGAPFASSPIVMTPSLVITTSGHAVQAGHRLNFFGSILTALLDSSTVLSLQLAAPMIDAVMRALGMGLAMGWEILWPLILGFALSGVVQAAVSHQ